MTPDADDYAAAHADPANMPCPHCTMPMPRSANFCPTCEWHVVTGTPHPVEDMPRAVSSAGRRPKTESARHREELIASFHARTGTSGPTLHDQLADNDRVLAALERDEDQAERALREILADRFKSAEGSDLESWVQDARRIASRRGAWEGNREDIDNLMEAFHRWTEASGALSRARRSQGQMLDRFYRGRLSEG